MGRTHALSGAVAGLVLGPVLGVDTVAVLAPFAVTTAGFALVPDLDHRSASATRLLGPITGGVSWCLRRGSMWLYARTTGPRDESRGPGGGQHRHATHTLVFAGLVGGVCAGTTALWGGWAALGWLLFGLLLAADRLGRVAVAAMAAGVGLWAVSAAASSQAFGPAMVASLQAMGGWLWIAVATGCVVHCLGDVVTNSGCPLLFPLRIHGAAWCELRPPRWLRFTTGGQVENWLVAPALTVALLLAVPGMPATVLDLAGELTPAA